MAAYPKAYKEALWVSLIGEEFKSVCPICNKFVNAFEFKINKGKKHTITHIKC